MTRSIMVKPRLETNHFGMLMFPETFCKTAAHRTENSQTIVVSSNNIFCTKKMICTTKFLKKINVNDAIYFCGTPLKISIADAFDRSPLLGVNLKNERLTLTPCGENQTNMAFLNTPFLFKDGDKPPSQMLLVSAKHNEHIPGDAIRVGVCKNEKSFNIIYLACSF